MEDLNRASDEHHGCQFFAMKVGRCRFTVSTLELKARLVSAISA